MASQLYPKVETNKTGDRLILDVHLLLGSCRLEHGITDNRGAISIFKDGSIVKELACCSICPRPNDLNKDCYSLAAKAASKAAWDGKDVYVDPLNVTTHGCNDHKAYGEIPGRAWTYRTIGYGHDVKVWKDIISALRLIGYDYVISIEHEDVLMSTDEGLSKAMHVLKEAVISEEPGETFWA